MLDMYAFTQDPSKLKTLFIFLVAEGAEVEGFLLQSEEDVGGE